MGMVFDMTIGLRLTFDLPNIYAFKVSDKARNAIAQKVLDEVHSRTPVKTGNLKRSIQAAFDKEHNVMVYSEIHYAPFVEYGHLISSGSFVEGRFMFRDGFNSSLNYVQDIIQKDIQDHIDASRNAPRENIFSKLFNMI